jgi:hypothetical protein
MKFSLISTPKINLILKAFNIKRSVYPVLLYEDVCGQGIKGQSTRTHS